jgi:uncharacterized surface protein with fasciclin (FAS1) repeats
MLRSAAYVVLTLLASAAIASPALAQTPPDSGMSAPPAAAAPVETLIPPDPSGTIVDNLKASGHFTTLLKALDASGLTSLLQRPGAFTLFAPTDEAFSAIPAADLANLMKPENAAKLQALLAYHVVNTKIAADQVLGHAPTPVPSVVNKPITLDGLNNMIKVNDAMVLQAAAPASNGVIYVINKVLTPPA